MLQYKSVSMISFLVADRHELFWLLFFSSWFLFLVIISMHRSTSGSGMSHDGITDKLLNHSRNCWSISHAFITNDWSNHCSLYNHHWSSHTHKNILFFHTLLKPLCVLPISSFHLTTFQGFFCCCTFSSLTLYLQIQILQFPNVSKYYVFCFIKGYFEAPITLPRPLWFWFET